MYLKINSDGEHQSHIENFGSYQKPNNNVTLLLDSKDKIFSGNEHQPKRRTLEILKNAGINTPESYNNFEEMVKAFQSHGHIAIRSEHKDEYNGPSGLAESLMLDTDDIEFSEKFITRFGITPSDKDFPIQLRKMKNEILSYRVDDVDSMYVGSNLHFILNPSRIDIGTGKQAFITLGIKYGILDENELRDLMISAAHTNLEDYCKYKGIDLETYKSGISYSYSKYEPGINLSVIEDSSIKGKYHIYICHDGKGENKVLIRTYCTYQNGKLLDNISRNKSELENNVIENIPSIIKMYNEMRSNFDENHCYMSEIQYLYNNNLLGLQLHRARYSETSDFNLIRDLKENEYKVEFVRGHTPKEGLEITYNPTNNENLRESYIRDINGYVAPAHGSTEYLGIMGGNHGDKSSIYKPKIFVIIPKELENLLKIGDKLHVISDGKTAYVSKVNS